MIYDVYESGFKFMNLIFHMVAELAEMLIYQFLQLITVHGTVQILGGIIGDERSKTNNTSQQGQARPLQVTDQPALQFTIHMLGSVSGARSSPESHRAA